MKTKEQLAQALANNPKNIIDLSCPRGTLNPGLYLGFIKGYESRDKEIKALIAWNQVLMDYQNQMVTHIEQLERSSLKSKLKAIGNKYWLFFQRLDLPWYVYLP